MEEAENENTGKRRAKGVGDEEKVMAKGLHNNAVACSRRLLI